MFLKLNSWFLSISQLHWKKSFIPVFYILVSGLFIYSVAEVKSWGFSLISFSSSPLMHNPSASPFSFASKMYSDFCSVSTAIPSSIHLGLCFHLCSSAPSVWCGQACCGPGLSSLVGLPSFLCNRQACLCPRTFDLFCLLLVSLCVCSSHHILSGHTWVLDTVYNVDSLSPSFCVSLSRSGPAVTFISCVALAQFLKPFILQGWMTAPS